jgi:hypothetical protein
MVFGPVATSREKVDGEKVRELMEGLYGPDVAKAAVIPASSKTAIEKALGMLAEAVRTGGNNLPYTEFMESAMTGKKVTKKALVEDFLSRLRDAGGISTTHGEEVKEHKA